MVTDLDFPLPVVVNCTQKFTTESKLTLFNECEMQQQWIVGPNIIRMCCRAIQRGGIFNWTFLHLDFLFQKAFRTRKPQWWVPYTFSWVSYTVFQQYLRLLFLSLVLVKIKSVFLHYVHAHAWCIILWILKFLVLDFSNLCCPQYFVVRAFFNIKVPPFFIRFW